MQVQIKEKVFIFSQKGLSLILILQSLHIILGIIPDAYM